jgi:SAM-dependent methyltransferase
MLNKKSKIQQKVINSFGFEWSNYSFEDDKNNEFIENQFKSYFNLINLEKYIPNSSVVCDFGAGSGRWTSKLTKYFGKVYALEPSDGANRILLRKFKENSKVIVLKETIEINSIPAHSLDLAISLGVIHHTPNPIDSLKKIAQSLKPDGLFLCYLYYDLENKPKIYKLIFKITNLFRLIISNLPDVVKLYIAKTIALSIYLPMARFAKLVEVLNMNAKNIPLHHYSKMPFRIMANDALDRFGTRIEHRFSKDKIRILLKEAGFNIDTLTFSDLEPYYTFKVNIN